MLSPWLEIPGIEQLVAELSDASKIDLRLHGTESDADTIRDTAVAQPLIVASSLIALAALDVDTKSIGVTGGHSVGEFAAAAVAGVFSGPSAVSLVALRSQAMARAAAAEPSGMSAVVGGDEDEVLAVINDLGLTPANMNGGGQIVAAGGLPELAALAERAPARSRVIPLAVAGAFHSRFMAGARDEFRAASATWTAQSPTIPLLSNADGAVLDAATSGSEVLARLVNQVASPVRWDLCQETIQQRGVTALVELLPGGVLTGLARRSLKGVPAVALKSPEDLTAARALISDHATNE